MNSPQFSKKLRALLTLGMILATCSACTTIQPATKDWCINDKWMCWSHKDTADTIGQIDEHNAGYLAACPLQPHTCKAP